MKADEVFKECLYWQVIPKKDARKLAAQYSARVKRKTLRSIDRNSPLGIYLRVERALRAKTA